MKAQGPRGFASAPAVQSKAAPPLATPSVGMQDTAAPFTLHCPSQGASSLSLRVLQGSRGLLFPWWTPYPHSLQHVFTTVPVGTPQRAVARVACPLLGQLGAR